jgi:peptidoglycan/LPS O-acetylase OafA/YrhL
VDPVTAAHAAAGVTGALLALAALRAPKRRGRHTRVGRVYVAVMVPMLLTAVVVGASDPAISPFEIAILPTAGPLAIGVLALVRRPRRLLGRHWLTCHIGGMGGSVIGLVSAGLFQTVGRVLPETPLTTALLFGLPTVLGVVLIDRAITRRVPPQRLGGAVPVRA